MRTARGIEVRSESANGFSPFPVIDVSRDVAYVQRPLTESRSPVRSIAPAVIVSDDIESGTVLVDRDESVSSLVTDLDLEPDDTADLAVLDKGKDPFDERMSGCEEVDRVVVHGFFAIERSDVARSARHTRKVVNERFISQFDRVRSPAARVLDGEPQSRADGDNHALVQRIELRWDTREQIGAHIGTVRLTMELLIGGLSNARARRAGVADERLESRVTQ